MFLLTLKKNVIIILIDGGRIDFAMKSPSFLNLQSNFVFFSQSITYAPYTLGAMHAVFSGCYGNRTGTNSYWSSYKFKSQNFVTLTEYLSAFEYYTCADIHSEIIIPKQGFDDFIIYNEDNEDVTKRHCNLIEKISNKNKRFFLYLHYSKIHTEIKNEVLKKYTNFSNEYFENKEFNTQRYAELFRNAEIYIDQIMNTIEDLELLENSVILILSDHGTSVGEKIGERAYGAFCYDYTLKTFAYLYTPDITPKTISSQVRHVDFMPTILDYLKIELDLDYENLDGESLLPLIHGNQMPEKIAFSETGNPRNESQPPKEPNVKAIRTSKWKLIHNDYDKTDELYDLENDPSEVNNLIGKNLEIEKELFSVLLTYTNNKN